MIDLKAYCSSQPRIPVLILDGAIHKSAYARVDLSSDNSRIQNLDLSNPDLCQKFIDGEMDRKNASVLYGGYLEKRNLYDGNSNFQYRESHRNIHLGIDFWTKAGTKVITPISGHIHSFKNNASIGDYGPTLILEHYLQGRRFFTLYGHLSLESLRGLSVGMRFEKGDTLGTLGSTEINVNYAPHLHFQIIMDIQGSIGDYPGVCARKDLKFYKRNCPDPNYILGMD